MKSIVFVKSANSQIPERFACPLCLDHFEDIESFGAHIVTHTKQTDATTIILNKHSNINSVQVFFSKISPSRTEIPAKRATELNDLVAISQREASSVQCVSSNTLSTTLLDPGAQYIHTHVRSADVMLAQLNALPILNLLFSITSLINCCHWLSYSQRITTLRNDHQAYEVHNRPGLIHSFCVAFKPLLLYYLSLN